MLLIFQAMRLSHLRAFLTYLIIILSAWHFEIMAPKQSKNVKGGYDDKSDKVETSQNVEEQTVADPNIPTSSSGDPLVQQIQMSMPTQPADDEPSLEELRKKLEDCQIEKDENKKRLDECKKRLNALKQKLKDAKAPKKEEMRKERAKAYALNRKLKNAKEREAIISINVQVDDGDGNQFNITVQVRQNISMGKLKDRVLELINRTLKKSDTLSIRFNGEEVYDTGLGSKGKKHLHTLGIKNGYNTDFIIDCGKQSLEELEEKNKGIPLGSAAEAEKDEEDGDEPSSDDADSSDESREEKQ